MQHIYLVSKIYLTISGINLIVKINNSMIDSIVSDMIHGPS